MGKRKTMRTYKWEGKSFKMDPVFRAQVYTELWDGKYRTDHELYKAYPDVPQHQLRFLLFTSGDYADHAQKAS